MENQVDKFARLCAVFDILVYDDNPDFIKLRKNNYQVVVSKWLLSNDRGLIKTLQDVYLSFRENEQNKS